MDYTEIDQFREEWFSPTPTITAHTSGSTGTPKAIALAKSDMRISAHATNRFFGINARSVLVCPLSVRYIAAKMMLVRAWEAGCRIEMLEPSNRFTLPYPASLLAIVPSQIPALATLGVNVDNVIVGGAPVTPEQETLLASLPANIYATYGMTETASHVALRRMGTPLYHALPGITFATDSRNCLVVNMPERTVNTLVTNDVVDLHTPTAFRWLGRHDNVINSGGIKLHPELLEREVNHPGAWYLTSRPSAQWGQEMIAIVDPSVPLAPLQAAINALLPSTHRPKAYLIRPVTYTPNGKLLRQPNGSFI